MPPNNSLKPTRLAGENAVVLCLAGCPRMKGRSPSRRAAWLEAVGRLGSPLPIPAVQGRTNQ
jgi:hypothetical protein